MTEITEFAVGNYYGSLMAKKEGDKFYWCVENYDGLHWSEINEVLYVALMELAPKDPVHGNDS